MCYLPVFFCFVLFFLFSFPWELWRRIYLPANPVFFNICKKFPLCFDVYQTGRQVSLGLSSMQEWCGYTAEQKGQQGVSSATDTKHKESIAHLSATLALNEDELCSVTALLSCRTARALSRPAWFALLLAVPPTFCPGGQKLSAQTGSQRVWSRWFWPRFSSLYFSSLT